MNFDKYQNQDPYPKLPAKPKREDYQTHAEHGMALDEWEYKLAVYKAAKKEHAAKTRLLQEHFKKDLIVEMNWDDFPEEVGTALVDYAYEHGHSGGFSEVYAIATDLDVMFERFSKYVSVRTPLYRIKYS